MIKLLILSFNISKSMQISKETNITFSFAGLTAVSTWLAGLIQAETEVVIYELTAVSQAHLHSIRSGHINVVLFTEKIPTSSTH